LHDLRSQNVTQDFSMGTNSNSIIKTPLLKGGWLCILLTSVLLDGFGQAAIPVTVEAGHSLAV
jgi:hypothetical protein